MINSLVEPPGDDTPGMLQEAVRIVLEKDPFVNASQIRVGVNGRVVRLDNPCVADEQHCVEVEQLDADVWDASPS